MKFRVWLKSRMADRVLAPLREEIVSLIEQDSNLLEIGCGTGDLLFRSADKLNHGLGIDIDEAMIAHAVARKAASDLNNIDFACVDAAEMHARHYDIVCSTLCLHEMGERDACRVLEKMVDISGQVIIADYSTAKTLSGRVGIELDEMFSGHYRNFRNYRKNGEIPAYAARVGAVVRDETASVIDGVSIWQISDAS